MLGMRMVFQFHIFSLQMTHYYLVKKNWANVRSIRAVLIIFEQMSRGKVNFQKIMLTWVNVSDSWLYEAASVLHC